MEKNQYLSTTLLFQASTDNEEQLQFPLELSSDPHMPQQFSPAKGWILFNYPLKKA